jgi:outer membrane protein assembly factor BamA
MFFNNIFASYTIDTRNDDILPSSGSYISVKTAYFPRYLKNEYAFGKASVNGKYYYSMNLPFFASLAFRGGAEKIWGKYPFFESSFIGGQNSLRGVEKNRFAGDASVYAGIEFRSFFEKFDLLVPVEAGFNLFAETARVFINNKYSAGTWHKTFGGGIMLSLLKRDYTINFSAAVSAEGTEYYFTSGFPF